MERISLSRCKKKKKKFPPYSTSTSCNDVVCVPTPVYHCRGLLPPRGLFCTFCSTQRSNSDHTFLSLSVVVCRHTCRHTREHQLYFIDRLSFRIYSFTNDINLNNKKKILESFPAWKQTVLLPLNPPAARRGSGPAGTFCWVLLTLQATKTVHWGGGFWFCMFHC